MTCVHTTQIDFFVFVHMWVAYTLLPFTVPFHQGAWELGPDCGNELHRVLLVLVTTLNWIDGRCKMWFKVGAVSFSGMLERL